MDLGARSGRPDREWVFFVNVPIGAVILPVTSLLASFVVADEAGRRDLDLIETLLDPYS